MDFFTELKRRNVFRVGFAYLIGSWLLAQIAELLLDTFNAPEWTMQFIVVVLMIGFPIAVFFAWAFELTPDGVKRESEVDRTQSVRRNTGQKLNRGILIVLIVALVYFVWESRFAELETDSIAQQSADQTISAEEQTTPTPIELVESEPVISRQSIAVLPFTNRSRNVDDEFFVEGIHDDLLTNLARIGSLKVISRTSVLRYQDTKKPIPEIAVELGVATILEGAVQRAGDTVRINVQLIDAMTDEHLWAEIFDRELTTDNLFAIQTEISGAIAKALEATLTVEEQTQISRKPTNNLAAYHAYTRGRQLQEKRTSASLEQALSEFRRAVELDPEYAQAWVGVADTLVLSHTYGTLELGDSNTQVRSAINRALEIDPLLGEAHTSHANSLLNSGASWADVEAEFKRGIELSPNYARAFHWYADELMSQPARLADALALGQKAVELDPMSPVLRVNMADTYNALGEFEKAEAGYLEVLELNPEFGAAFSRLSGLNSQDYGRFDEALKWWQKSQEIDPGNIQNFMNEFMPLVLVGEPDLAAESIKSAENLDPDHQIISLGHMLQNILNQRYAAAAEHANYMAGRQNSPWIQWSAGIAQAFAGHYAKARELMLRVEPGYSDPEQWERLLNERQDDACLIGWVLMQTGDETLGHDLIQQTITYLTVTLPQYIKHADRYSAEICYAALGETDAALDALELTVANNYIADWSFNRLWPPMRELWDEPRFIAAQQKVEEELARQRVIIRAMYADQGSSP